MGGRPGHRDGRTFILRRGAIDVSTRLGIDIGGTTIKGAVVDVDAGTLRTLRHVIKTPRPAHPEAVVAVVMEMVTHFEWTDPVGCTFPAVVKKGVTLTAANVDPTWVGTNAEALFEQGTGRAFTVLNDADAAGLAEMRFGAGVDRGGLVLMVTLGTGIGSALFLDGKLVPNSELGHLELDGADAERQASERVHVERNLSWEVWAERVNAYLRRLEVLLWPDLIIVGGGVSEQSEKFFPLLREVRCELVPARLLNDAGIVGAAVASSLER
jgi:polyphosphate glucokinase